MHASHLTLEPLVSRRGSGPELSELSLLLPTWQIQGLSEIAQDRGMTVAQLLRGMIQQIVPVQKIGAN